MKGNMKFSGIIVLLLFADILVAQRRFDSLRVKQLLTTLPGEWKVSKLDRDIIQAIHAVDRKYRKISDSLYYYKSRAHTIFQTLLIEVDSGMIINPLDYGNNLRLKNIIFASHSLDSTLTCIADALNSIEKEKLFDYLAANFDYFDYEDKKLTAKPVRIRTIKFPDKRYVHVGIDIYGRHSLWKIDREKSWDVVAVEGLWVY